MHGVSGLTLSPIVRFAKRAAAGEALLVLSHSRIAPPGYASTSEVADYLLAEIGGLRVPMQGMNPLGAELSTGLDLGGVHVRGYEGGDKFAHCAHTALLAEAVRDTLEPAWGTGTAAGVTYGADSSFAP